MIVVISPAKTLDFTPQTLTTEATKPAFQSQSKKIIEILRQRSSADFRKLMGISEKLATDVHGYVNNWKAKYNSKQAKQAILAFRGDVYLGLEADKFSSEDFQFAQQHLRILSGLYGVLRPLDLMQPYRLEMGTRLANDHGKDLYAFWGDKIAKELKKSLADQDDPLLVIFCSTISEMPAVNSARPVATMTTKPRARISSCRTTC